MPTSVRLDSETEPLLSQLAHRRNQTKSDIIRDALHRLAQDEQTDTADNSPYALVSDLIGIAKGGPDDLARHHTEAFREILAQKQKK